MDSFNHFTKFGTDRGEDVGYPAQINQNFGAQLHVVGEADPSRYSPLDTNQNLLESGVSENSVWGIQMGSAHFGDSLL